MKQSTVVMRPLLCIIICITAQVARSQSLPDSELKLNISPISDPLASLSRLQPKVYEYNTKEYPQLRLPAGKQYGFISEDFQRVFPSLTYKKNFSIMRGKNNFNTATAHQLQLQGLIPVLVASLQQQQAMIEQLRKEINELKRG